METRQQPETDIQLDYEAKTDRNQQATSEIGHKPRTPKNRTEPPMRNTETRQKANYDASSEIRKRRNEIRFNQA